MINRLNITKTVVPASTFLCMLPNLGAYGKDATSSPNILMVILDDQSYPYTSAYGCKSVSTPGFDYVANKGALMYNAYVTSPGSSPSRASILTGLYPWQIEEAGTHASSFPSKYKCYPDILEENGYKVGFTGKGWGPGDWKVSGRKRNPAGEEYNKLRTEVPFSGISKIDYASNFSMFLDNLEAGKPFCFWLGTNEPHRGYERDSWKKTSHKIEDAVVPGYLPDNTVVRGDILDYAVEIEWADNHIMKAIKDLERRGLLENTLIVVMADNGMAFPHAKSTCYDPGLHIPMAICWPGHIVKGNKIMNEVSSIDLLPTFLEAAGVKVDIPYNFSGKSLLPLLKNKKVKDNQIFSGRERHSSARPGNAGYPIRSMRSGEWLIIRNFHPERLPAGNSRIIRKDGTLGKEDGAYFDIDGSPTLTYLIDHKKESDIKPFFELAVLRNPEYEMYNVRKDPDCMINLANDIKHRKIFNKMKKMLNDYLVKTKDTRMGPNPEIWESYPRIVGDNRDFPEE